MCKIGDRISEIQQENAMSQNNSRSHRSSKSGQSQMSNRSQHSDVAVEAAALKAKLKYIDAEALSKAELEKKTPCKKGTSRQRSGKGAIRKRFPLQKPRWEKTKLTIRYLYHETYRKPNEQLLSQWWPLSYLNLTKTIKTHIRRQQHKKI